MRSGARVRLVMRALSRSGERGSMTGAGLECSHMTSDWQWDETLFKGSAAYYVRGRRPYARAYPAALAAALRLDGRGRLLDVGCGPGVVALELAPYFAEVVGVDPDGGMLAEAERRGIELGVRNARWVRARGEDLPAGLGVFRVATFARSFHWMERDRVAATVFDMLEADGPCVQVTESWEGVPTAEPPQRPAMPQDAVRDLVHRYLGPERRAGQGVRATSPDGEHIVLEGAGFAPAQIIRVAGDGIRTRDIDGAVAYVLSGSDAAPHLFGERFEAFVRELRELLLAASPSGLFDEILPETELRIWRKAPGA